MVRKIKGFTIIEMAVVIAIISIFTSIAFTSFLKWKKKVDTENDIKKIYSLLQKYRIRAFAEKEIYEFNFSSSGDSIYVKDSDGTNVGTLNLKEKFAFKSSNISIDTRGTFSGSAIKPLDLSSNINYNYNCIVVNDGRIKIGKWYDSSNSCTP